MKETLDVTEKSTALSVPVTTDTSGRLLVDGGRGQAAIEGRLYCGDTQGEVKTSTTMHTTFTGLALGNPHGSGKYYVLWEFSYAHTEEIKDETNLALAVGNTSGLANETVSLVRNCLAGAPVLSEAILDTSATIVAPVVVKQIASLDDHLAGSQWTTSPQVVNINGTIVLAPGTAVFTDSTYAIQSAAADDVCIHFGYVWEEVDIV